MPMGDTEQFLAQVGIAYAAGQALGPLIAPSVEGLKATPLIPAGWAGVAAHIIGIIIGLLVGLMALLHDGDPSWLVVGVVAGLVAGGKAVDAHYAATGKVVSAALEAPPRTP